ncbi:stage VI sporulation protein D [Bacillus carboniphilus]|uniref:Stage VI sporulation protein D n=1 Tax=Bacillus carboniphilus TaxID=86663 RepID=A0ABY9JZ88_9BACI|nr:stage VI sporulation protein D [Bacillus carboniphilus]WLR44099.1 stage VI sporulation protein D [Bacillus carboniphilus]
MSEAQSPLRFEVEEVIWFQKGQEVRELVNMSLEPDVAIQEHEQYVSIKGALILTGEYRMASELNTVDSTVIHPNARYIHEVTTRDDGVSEFINRFPVDITIPRDRINSLEEIYVNVDSFDYDFPETRCLQLQAGLLISGLQDQVQLNSEREEGSVSIQEQPESIEDVEQEALYRSTTLEEDVPIVEPQVEERVQTLLDEDETDEHELYTIYEEEEEDELTVEVRKARSPQTPNHQMEQGINQTSIQPMNQGGQEEEEERTNDNSLYLKDLFTTSEEEDFSKLKLCIVQQGDSLESICERYDVSMQQLIRVNQLSADDDVSEGQIVYIPLYSMQNS